MAGQTTWNKATAPAGTEPWGYVAQVNRALNTAGLVFGVATTAERNNLAASAPGGVLPVPTLVRNAQTGRYESWNGTRWTQVAEIRLGRNQLAATITVPDSATWADICTVTATSLGGTCTSDFKAVFQNANSGANRTVTFRITVDGTAIAVIVLDAPYRAGEQPKYTAAFDLESTPTAASHTWVLQANASAASAVQVVAGVLTVNEQP